jgi:ribokinase
MICVFGSINVDISVSTDRLPVAGETVMGGQAMLSPGGKGANQAHAARLFGVPVLMFGATGDDSFSAPALQCLKQAGVDLNGVDTMADQATGIAMIVLDAQGENTIVVAPGANLAARAEQVPDQALLDARVLLLQLETDGAQNLLLAQRARRLGCTVILNASPLRADVPLELAQAGILIVNQGEVSQLAAQHGQTDGTPAELAGALARACDCEVLVTLGGQGALLTDANGGVLSAAALPVNAVDTTGAGDTFAGVFAAAIAGGAMRQDALEYAAIAAGLACTRRGAQVAQPTREEIDKEKKA